MKLVSKITLGIGLLLFLNTSVVAQQHPRFWNNIQKFKHQDSLKFPPQKAILFIGSSSFTKWKDVQQYFPKHKIINRGFGGSSLPDVIRYADDIIFPYRPKQIVIYCGDNDAASSDKISADSILSRLKQLYQLIRSRLPRTKVTYISIKPSPSRERFFPVMQKANWEIKNFLQKEKRADFVDIWHLMLDDYGQPRKELFGSDMLHMNSKGYTIWQKAIKPHLVR